MKVEDSTEVIYLPNLVKPEFTPETDQVQKIPSLSDFFASKLGQQNADINFQN